MSSAFIVPAKYQYVIAALSTIPIVVWGQTIAVAVYRRRSGIKYPQMYADKAQVEANKDAYIFNCAQRAHQNTLEGLPLVVLNTAIVGLQYPLASAAFCAFWVYSRIPYTLGYISGEPDKRGKWGAQYSFIGSMVFSGISVFVTGKRLWEAGGFNLF